MAYCSNMIYQLNKNCIANPLILDDIVLRQLHGSLLCASGFILRRTQTAIRLKYNSFFGV